MIFRKKMSCYDSYSRLKHNVIFFAVMILFFFFFFFFFPVDVTYYWLMECFSWYDTTLNLLLYLNYVYFNVIQAADTNGE